MSPFFYLFVKLFVLRPLFVIVRDNYRCMATGGIDLNSCMEYEELQGLPQVPTVVSTECTHTSSEPTSVRTEDERKVSMPFHLSGSLLVHCALRGHSPRTPEQSFANLDIRTSLVNWVAQIVTFTDWRTL